MIHRRQRTVFLNLHVISVSLAKPLIKKKEATAIKTEGEELVIFLSGGEQEKDQWLWWRLLPQLWHSVALKNSSRKDIIDTSVFEANAKNNFPHITFPTETTHCCGTKHPSQPCSYSLTHSSREICSFIYCPIRDWWVKELASSLSRPTKGTLFL